MDNKFTPVIGKDVIESLTIGMYEDSRFIFREYIQNSADQIDKAVREGLLEKNQGEIHIIIEAEKRKIIIEDNRILPRPQVVAIGAVKEVSKNSLTLESRLNNSTFTFSLDKDTQIFDAEDDEISTLSLFEDVQVVVAGYVSTENDDEQSNTAQVIKALVNLD